MTAHDAKYEERGADWLVEGGGGAERRSERWLARLLAAAVVATFCALAFVACCCAFLVVTGATERWPTRAACDVVKPRQEATVPRRLAVELRDVVRCPSGRLRFKHLPCRRQNQFVTGPAQQLPLRMQDDFVGHFNDFRLMQDRIRITKEGVYSLQLQLQFLYKFETPTELSALVYVNGTGEFLCVASAAGSRSGIAACSVNAHLRLGAGSVIDFRVTVAGVGVLAERRSSFIVLHRLS